jgi:hypothetical protein
MNLNSEPLKSYIDSHWSEQTRIYIAQRIIKHRTSELRWVIRTLTPILQQKYIIVVSFSVGVWMWGDFVKEDDKSIWIDVPFEDEFENE